MRFGVFYELQMPKPWDARSEARIVHEALEQVALADRLGFDYAWCVEHHFLEEYSHCSAPEVFLAAAAARTQSIRLGHGIRQVIPRYNHPARTAEGLGMLDLISNGRVDFGIGEGATRLELGGFEIGAKEKRALALEAAEQIANMMVLAPYPGFSGNGFTMPCRNVIPKPIQKPHPPMWMACTNRDTIRVAAKHGLGALAFAFVDPDEARTWSTIYYDTIKSDECVPLGHAVNANLATVSAFSIHPDRAEAIRRGQEGFEFFFFAVNALVAQDARPGHSHLWESFQRLRGNRTAELIARADDAGYQGAGIGTPDDMRRHLREQQAAGVDQVIFLQQAGHNRHEEILASLELFAHEIAPQFRREAAVREERKAAELAPYVARALARKQWMAPLAESDVPIVTASRAKAEVNQATLRR
jgi:alkanesulfonate monooxygenase SsuD/methylene tetrahydromethanopterin reductase-like flavin-dependent oxidoreductase (luciferase family)